MNIRPMTETDAPAVLAIYQAGIDTGHAELLDWIDRWLSR